MKLSLKVKNSPHRNGNDQSTPRTPSATPASQRESLAKLDITSSTHSGDGGSAYAKSDGFEKRLRDQESQSNYQSDSHVDKKLCQQAETQVGEQKRSGRRRRRIYTHVKKNRKSKISENNPTDPDDITSSHPGQTSWSIDNLPDILYVLHPTAAHTKSRNAILMTPFLSFGKRVKNYLVLPRQISSRVEGWRLEAWMRTDRRITAQDIIDRINPRYGITVDDIMARREEFREKFHLANWDARPNSILKTKLVVAGLDPKSNSTRGLTPGLIDPKKGEEGGRIPLPPDTLHVLGYGNKENALRLNEASDHVGSSYSPGKVTSSQDSSTYIQSSEHPSQVSMSVDEYRNSASDNGNNLCVRNNAKSIRLVNNKNDTSLTNDANSGHIANRKSEQYFYYSSDEAPTYADTLKTTGNDKINNDDHRAAEEMAFNNTRMDLEYQLDIQAETPILNTIDISDYFPEYPEEVTELAHYRPQLGTPRGDNPIFGVH
ncbi:hypothetical protein PHISCL_07648 [Aspergillus sclerotialis]|uniref:Uncharacterized protein n=1 Tax=Aspergillus sclerotialis TaxID=2070753 RepID=A0A3A2ZA64_9EURO|nr:hypothetical protein PHISCL_07648 [Aspergillus sclerotialis]